MSALRTLKRNAQKPGMMVRVQRGNGKQESVRTYWNGEPTSARRVIVRVGTVPVPTWWCAGLEGTERQAVEVTYGKQTFYLDNENGSAWGKVTHGYGGPEWGHSSLPDDSEVLRDID